MKLLKSRKTFISAIVILVVAWIASLVATPADSGSSSIVIFLLVSSALLFIDDDSCW